MEIIKIIVFWIIASIFFEGFGMGWWGLIPAIIIFGFILPLLEEFEDKKRETQWDTDAIVRNVRLSIYPNSGKVEVINIYLDNPRYFYDIPPDRLKNVLSKLTIELEKIIQKNKKSNSYGYDYAVRKFYAGNELIYNWTKSA